jgi:hypothetical protein
VNANKPAEPPNIKTGCSENVTRNGKWNVALATTAPRPVLTRRMGSAQQMRVPVEATREIQVLERSSDRVVSIGE